jgi:hypothetical protein
MISVMPYPDVKEEGSWAIGTYKKMTWIRQVIAEYQQIG